MIQIHKEVQALESDIEFWWPTWILSKKLKYAKKKLQGKFPRANMHTANIKKRGAWLYYQILIMAKISKTEISAKILKRKKSKVFIIRIRPKAFQLAARVFPSNQT